MVASEPSRPPAPPPPAEPRRVGPARPFTRPTRLVLLLLPALAATLGCAPAPPAGPASEDAPAASAPATPGVSLPTPGVSPPAPGSSPQAPGSSPQAQEAAPADQPAGAEAAPAEPAFSELVEIEGPLLEADTWQRLGDRLLVRAIDFVPALVQALIVVLAFFVIYRISRGVLGGVLRRTRADPALQSLSVKLLRYAILILATIMALGQLGFNIASILAAAGIVGLAIGLAAQETVANLIAGLTILWDRPFRIGDNVTIADTFGKVRSIGLRTTRIETVERLDCILPNKEVIEQKIINHTMSPEYRLPVPVGIAYKEDSRKARKVLLAAVGGHELILDDPAPVVVVTGLGDSSVNLELRVWLKDPYTEREALFDLIELAKIALDEAGIEIPFPQRTLHFGSDTVPLRVEERTAGGGEAGGGRRGEEGTA